MAKLLSLTICILIFVANTQHICTTTEQRFGVDSVLENDMKYQVLTLLNKNGANEIIEQPIQYIRKTWCNKTNRNKILQQSIFGKNFHVNGFTSIILEKTANFVVRLYIFERGSLNNSIGNNQRKNMTEILEKARLRVMSMNNGTMQIVDPHENVTEVIGSILMHNHQFSFLSMTLYGKMHNIEFKEIKCATTKKEIETFINHFNYSVVKEKLKSGQYFITQQYAFGSAIAQINNGTMAGPMFHNRKKRTYQPMNWCILGVKRKDEIPQGFAYTFDRHALHSIKVSAEKDNVYVLFIEGPRAANHPSKGFCEFKLVEEETLPDFLYQSINATELEQHISTLFSKLNLQLCDHHMTTT
ncbi:hypothetical protein RFI_00390 [Reticulomyxa filosa]|uniref:Uncharacterized protein n=1 Tax=Reticulomyxa filosa TaxID=46433 RepID=X6PG52_RETFI|nr:hypothetical protein RFI_00390 [Reticulomyxa filosa]|eukprot:ETO36672.1 hypothetical protein RFI_00390 [Reticulomyxa filosa]